jgi:hypothetical protein
MGIFSHGGEDFAWAGPTLHLAAWLSALIEVVEAGTRYATRSSKGTS